MTKRVVILLAASFLLLVVTVYALPTWLGCGAEPADVDNKTSSGYAYIHDAITCAEAGEVTQIQAFCNGYSGSLEFAVFSKSGSNFTDKYYTGLLETTDYILHTWDAPADFTAFPIAVGDYIGFNCTDVGTLEKATSGGTGYWFYSGDPIGDDDADEFSQSGNTTHEIQFRFYITAAGEGPLMNTSTNCSFGSVNHDKVDSVLFDMRSLACVYGVTGPRD